MSTSGGAVGVVPLPVGIPAGGTGAVTAGAARAALHAGTAILGAHADGVFADISTPIPSDNNPHVVACVKAAPPPWLDNAGNITAAGLYLVRGISIASAGFAIATLVHYVQPPGGASIDHTTGAVDLAGALTSDSVLVLAPGEVPAATNTTFRTQIDATGVILANVAVYRLAEIAP